MLDDAQPLLDVIDDVDAVPRDAEDALHGPLGLAVRVHDQDRCVTHARSRYQIPFPPRLFRMTRAAQNSVPMAALPNSIAKIGPRPASGL